MSTGHFTDKSYCYVSATYSEFVPLINKEGMSTMLDNNMDVIN